jgi:hypothetical protein
MTLPMDKDNELSLYTLNIRAAQADRMSSLQTSWLMVGLGFY